jgi:hypothetical protein
VLIINTLQRRFGNAQKVAFRSCSTAFLLNKNRSKMFTSGSQQECFIADAKNGEYFLGGKAFPKIHLER